MNLRVFSPEVRDVEGKVISEESSKVLYGITDLHIEFTRNTFEVTHRAPNGAMLHEVGELHRLFPKGKLSDFVFNLPGDAPVESAVGNFIDPTTVSTASVTSPTGGTVVQDQVTRVEPTGNQEDVSDSKPHAVVVPSTGKSSVTSVEEMKKRMEAMNKASGVKETPEPNKPEAKTASVPVESGVGHLIDPTTTPTDKITASNTNTDMLAVSDATTNRQGPTAPPTVNP